MEKKYCLYMLLKSSLKNNGCKKNQCGYDQTTVRNPKMINKNDQVFT